MPTENIQVHYEEIKGDGYSKKVDYPSTDVIDAIQQFTLDPKTPSFKNIIAIHTDSVRVSKS